MAEQTSGDNDVTPNTTENQPEQSEQIDNEVNAADTSGSDSELAELRLQLETAQQEAGELRDAALRAKAEVDNVRRRAERDVEQAHKYALEGFVNALLPIIDSLEQGLQQPTTNDESSALKTGMELTLKMFGDTLAKKNVVTLDPVGETFNPTEHEAMSMQDNPDMPPNAVIAVFQKGYSLNGRIVRPARVVVNKGKPSNIDKTV